VPRRSDPGGARDGEKCRIDLPLFTSTVATNVPGISLAGAEPANSSASLAAEEYGLRFMTVEQDDLLGGLIYHSPLQKLAMIVT
jgi:hypothetical protein